MIELRYPYFKRKCFTISLDDGVIQDVPVIKLLDKYNVKGTFNLNFGLFSQIKFRDGVDNSRLSLSDAKALYINHEIASHSLYHFHMENLDYEQNKFQIEEDINLLTKELNANIHGFAYPYGKYNDCTLKVLRENNILYARTTLPSYSFKASKDLLLLQPTCSFSDGKLLELCDKFVSCKDELALFYVWGHSYELENNNSWETFEQMLKKISNLKDACYLTNFEALNYIDCTRKLEIKNDELINYSSQPIYLNKDGKNIILLPMNKISLYEE